MEKKYLVEISEAYSFQVDNSIAECCYATIDDLDEKILKTIDTEDIRSWTPIGGREFVEKFNKLFINS